MRGPRIRIGIVGYGNLGRGVLAACRQTPDLTPAAIFTRRDPKTIEASIPVQSVHQLPEWQKRLDVLILCGGSATDLPRQTPELAASFNVVDSFDTHARIPTHFRKVDQTARKAGTLALLCSGWDPGLFSLMRVLGEAVLPKGETHTFWGPGVSQGHSDAIRRIPGVRHAVQYTIPLPAALRAVRSGKGQGLTSAQKHRRLCFVALEPDADRKAVEHAIKTMPHYFAEYETTVRFVSESVLRTRHAGMPHGGQVIRFGVTGEGTPQRLEFHLQLGSNPEFTAGVLAASARAVYRLHRSGHVGALTLLDIPIGLLSPHAPDRLRRQYL